MTITINSNITLRNKTDLANNIRAGITHNINDAIDGLMTVFGNQLENEVATNSTFIRTAKDSTNPMLKFLPRSRRTNLRAKILMTNRLLKFSAE